MFSTNLTKEEAMQKFMEQGQPDVLVSRCHVGLVCDELWLYDSGAVLDMCKSEPPANARRNETRPDTISGLGGVVNVTDVADFDLVSKVVSGRDYEFTLSDVIWCQENSYNILSSGHLSEWDGKDELMREGRKAITTWFRLMEENTG